VRVHATTVNCTDCGYRAAVTTCVAAAVHAAGLSFADRAETAAGRIAYGAVAYPGWLLDRLLDHSGNGQRPLEA
jgi:hypothetical protein